MIGTIIITGGRGFVGRHLVRELEEAWPQATVTVWDQPEVDITNPDTFRDRLAGEQPAWLMHLAAVSGVGHSLQDPELTQRVNVDGTRQLLEAIAELSGATRVLAVSTADIYGQGSSEPLAELPLREAKPNNPYAVSKLAMEQLIEDSYNDRVIRVRPFPHIGPGQQLGFVTADFASQIAAIEKGEQEPVIKVGNLEARRDFTDVRDVVRAYRLLMEHEAVGEVFHVASGHAITIQSILDQLLALSNAEISVASDPARMRPSDTPIIIGDASKLNQLTGWEPTIPLEQSLRDVLVWWRKTAT